MKCEFCGTEIPFEKTQCPNCGAPCQYIKKDDIDDDQRSGNNSGRPKDKSDKNSDFIPMGSADISFLQQNQEEEEETADISHYSGCFMWGGVIAVIILIIFLLSQCS